MKKVLITGSQGFIGPYCARSFAAAGFEVLAACREHVRTGETSSPVVMDIVEPDSIGAVFAEQRPDAVVHLAGIKDLPACEKDPELTHRLNVEGTVHIARACLEYDAHLIFMSSDYVFRGDRGGYVESDAVSPSTVYGRSKSDAEQRLRELGVRASVCRSGGVYANASSQSTLLTWAAGALAGGEVIEAFSNVYNTPTCILDLTRALRHLAQTGMTGTFHVAGNKVSRSELLSAFARAKGHPESLIRAGAYEAPSGQTEFSRPCDLSLDTRETCRKLGFEFMSVEAGFAALASDL
jgi:dTDP-4-dehydrorhamnose reductase